MASQQSAGGITSSGKPGLVSTERGRNGPNEDDVGQAFEGVARAKGHGNGDSDEEDEENLDEQGQVPGSARRNPIDDIFGNRGKTTGLDDEELEAEATSEPQDESDSDSDSSGEDDSDDDQVGFKGGWKPSGTEQKLACEVFAEVVGLSPRVIQRVCREGLFKKEYLRRFEPNQLPCSRKAFKWTMAEELNFLHFCG
jgi:hypothetical protein